MSGPRPARTALSRTALSRTVLSPIVPVRTAPFRLAAAGTGTVPHPEGGTAASIRTTHPVPVPVPKTVRNKERPS
ncbi:hypothetical protein [Streptomyces sp. NPDC048669]|uniref:hypothetical protein n=1 Tax=Streptomyces sp. NPDC048669 TaxID=3155267 RepID=UPI00343B1EA3